VAKKRKKQHAKKPPQAPGASPAPPQEKIEEKQPSRGAQRRQAARADRARDVGAAPSPELGPAKDPVFWFGFEVPWAKLLLARVVVFAVLAVDALMQIEHAPRYGAGGFNVAQLPLLDALAPGRVLYSVGQLVLAYLFVLVACGALTRYVLPIATAIYGWLYFSSHLDSYQHHYLVWLVLVISCFVPWQRQAGAIATTPVRSWALRLLYIQLALLYLWAAVSKMNSAWLDGKALSLQMSGVVRSIIDHTIGIKGSAWFVLVTELVLAATVWNKRTWFIAFPLGIALHAGILVASLDIGLFAWLMLGIYLLVLPDRVYLWAGGKLPRLGRVPVDGALQWIAWMFAAATGLLLAGTSRWDHGWPVGVGLLAALLGATIVTRKRDSVARLAVAHVLAFTMWAAVDRTTKTASDYYRLWGGSSKRLGDPKTSEYAYRRMTQIAPHEGGGHYQLGKLLIERGAAEEGVAALHRAQEAEPLRARAYVAEARWLAANQRLDEAIAKAREATIVEPGDQDAASLLNQLLSR
jgi:hypothetical protein